VKETPEADEQSKQLGCRSSEAVMSKNSIQMQIFEAVMNNINWKIQ